MVDLLRACRPINLLIVGSTQIIFYYICFLKYQNDFALALGQKLILPFILVTLIIAACGYFINDYFDFNSDIKNNKTNKLSQRNKYLIGYFVLFILGCLLSLWIAYEIDKIFLSLIYLAASSLLFLYSSHLKALPLIGNIIVSLFSVFTLLILLYAEQHIISETHWRSVVLGGHAQGILIFYSAFIFFLSFARELIKDIEDIDGDKYTNYKTYPLVKGLQKSKNLTLALFIILIAASLIWLFYSWNFFNNMLIIFYILSIFLPTIYIGIRIWNANMKNEFSKISTLCKILMFSGLVYIIVVSWN